MNEPSSAQSRLLRVLQEALTWLVPLLLFVHIRLKVLYQSRDLMHGEEELTQGILGHHLIYGRLAPFMAYQHTQDAGGTLHTGLFSYIPFSLVDQTYASLKLVPLGVGVLILLIWMLFFRLHWGRLGAFLFGILLCVLPDFLLKRGLYAFGNHHDLVALLGLMYMAFFAVVARAPDRLSQIAFAALWGAAAGYALYIDLSVLPFLPLFALMLWTADFRRVRLLSWLALLLAGRLAFSLWYESHQIHGLLKYLTVFMDQGVPWGVEDKPDAGWSFGALADATRFSNAPISNLAFHLWLYTSCGLILWINRSRLLSAARALSPFGRHKMEEPMDWIYIVLPVSFLAFTASFFVFTRGQAGHPNLIRYWTPLYAVMIGCQAQGILLWVRSSRRWLAAAGMAFVPVYFGVMYIGIPEVHADRATDEELLKPGYSYFYFTGNLIAFYEMPVDQALLSDLDVSRSYDGQRDLFEGICVGIGALTGYDVSGHLELARDYSADRRIMVYRGMGFGAGLAGLKWEDPPGGLPDVGADERIWIRSGEKRLVEQVGRAKFIDRYRDRVKDFRALPDSVDAKP